MIVVRCRLTAVHGSSERTSLLGPRNVFRTYVVFITSIVLSIAYAKSQTFVVTTVTVADSDDSKGFTNKSGQQFRRQFEAHFHQLI